MLGTGHSNQVQQRLCILVLEGGPGGAEEGEDARPAGDGAERKTVCVGEVQGTWKPVAKRSVHLIRPLKKLLGDLGSARGGMTLS